MFFLAVILASSVLVITNSSRLDAQPWRNTWHFTAQEIEIAYRYQLDYGKGLRQPLLASRCQLGAEFFSANMYGKERRLPCRFITETIRHLKEILQEGAARYLFPLDLNHAHLAIPKTSWYEKYEKLPSEMILPAIIKDPQLVALYHSAEHLLVKDPQTGKVNPAVKEWQEKRNILGFYDGRPIEILTPHPQGAGVGVPEKYWSYGAFEFLASRGARLAVILDDSAVGVDIKLEVGGNSAAQLWGGVAVNP